MFKILGILALLVISSPVWALRCGTELITEGTPVYKVLHNCPVVDQTIEHIFVEKDGVVYILRITNSTVNSIERG